MQPYFYEEKINICSYVIVNGWTSVILNILFQANSKYLSCIATSCFHIAAKTQEKPVFIPSAAELVKLSQCGGAAVDLERMEGLILEKLQWQLDVVTPLHFLQLFCDMIEDKENSGFFTSLVPSLDVLMCRFNIAKYRVRKSCLLSFHFKSDFNLKH